MSFASRFERVFRAVLPTPFTIAVLLTFLTIALALLFQFSTVGSADLPEVLSFWNTGLWDPHMLAFAVQMMLILVLGHILALSPPAAKIIQRITALANGPASAAWLVTFSTMLVAYFNWGLGLIFGAIIARSMAARFSDMGKPLNYPLIGAAGYSGLMIWHGGISGSAPAKVAEDGHLAQLMEGVYSPEQINSLPASISFSETIFSSMNLWSAAILLLVLPLITAVISKRSAVNSTEVKPIQFHTLPEPKPQGAERLDHSRWFAIAFALLIIGYNIYIPFAQPGPSLGFLNLNYINLSLLGLGLLLHGNISRFLSALEDAISGAAGILVQFPLYFGIIGIMKYSGLVEYMSEFFISISNTHTFPLFSFFSAAIVNVFVPSGGGQWSIQGPILIQAAQQLGVPLSKGVMAIAYGDQITNMLQPFWALPLLAITGLKAREIIPYSLLLMLVGLIVFIAILLLF